MYIKIHKTEDYNKSSCAKLAEYLEKENEKENLENRQMFFNQNSDSVSMNEVINKIDSNKARLGKEDDKYFMISINPSERELKHICKQITGRDIDNVNQLTRSERKQYELQLKEFARNTMNTYAKNFNRGLNGNDILYFGKVEHIRKVKRDNTALILDRQKHIKLTKNDLDNIKYCHNYYSDKRVQELCHGMKEGDINAIKSVSKEMVNTIPDNAILIPMPSSCGYATYTKTLSEEIAKLNPSLQVMDVLKGAEREKLFDLKKKGFEANQKYFNFQLSGTIPKDREVYFVDNVLSTGTTYVNAKEVLPQAKLAVYGCNEETSVKKLKLEQLQNLQNTPLPKIGDIKSGLQSHIHVIVSRKDISNTIKLSPFANARSSLNKLPNGEKAQIGFDRKQFVSDCEKNFDTQFSYNREFSKSFGYYHLMKNQACSLTKNLSYNLLPEELRTIGKSTEQAISIINKINTLCSQKSTISIANELRRSVPTLNQLSAASDVFRVQSEVLATEFKNFSANVPIPADMVNKVNGVSDRMVELSKRLSEVHSKTYFISSKEVVSSSKMYSAINAFKAQQGEIYALLKNIDNQNAILNQTRNELFKTLRDFKNDPNFSYIKGEILTKVDLINRAQKDLSFQKANISECSKIMSNTQRPSDPMQLIQSTFQHVPIAKEVMQAVNYAYNPTQLAVDLTKKAVSSVLSAGMGI